MSTHNKMNTPNKLTVLRFILSPLFLVVLVTEFPAGGQFPWHLVAAFVIFVFAAVTDAVDGHLARKNNLITNFGKFLDPIADKMLTTAAFLGFLHQGYGFGILWITFIVLLREFIVTSVRLVAINNGKVIAANSLGKLKTVMQVVAIGTVIGFEFITRVVETIVPDNFLIVNLAFWMWVVYSALLWISTGLTIVSGVTYIKSSREFIDTNN